METTRRELGFAEMILRKGRPKKKKVPVIKKSEVEEKLLFEIEMREAAQRLLSACSNSQQRLDAGKTILTSNSRTLALMTALQKEHVKEVEDAHGLTDLKDKDELLREEMMESVSLADVTISNIHLPLKWCRIDHNKYKTDCWKYQVFCLIRSGIQVLDSSELTKVDLLTDNILLKDTFVLKNLGPDFTIDIEFYYAQSEDTVKQRKNKKAEQTETTAPVFAIAATASLSLAHCNIWSQKQSLKSGSSGLPAHITAPTSLPELPPLPVLNFYRAEIDVTPHFTLKPSKEGFLDVQQMSQGMPHWAKCWCSLQGMYLKAWKQPEDQFVTEPVLIIEINEHIMLDHVPRSSVQRPNTIHVSYCKSPYADHYLSTDTKEDRILWEIVLRKAMINSSTWHPNKLSSIENQGTCPSPLKSPPPKPPRPVTGPQFSYTPGNPCLPAYRAQYDATRSSRRDKFDWTPGKRSKSAERKPKTPATHETHRSRANTCKKPNRRRSRSVELTPLRMVAPTTPNPHVMDTPKRDRISDATYVSMHKFSRVPVSGVTPSGVTKPSRQPPRPPQPPSLSKLPGSPSKKTPARPLSKVNESYRTAVHMNTPPQTSPQKESPSPRKQKLQVDLSNREHKKRAPTPQKHQGKSPQKSCAVHSSRSKKSPAPVPQRRVRVPRQSQGGTNNLNSPNRSDLKNKEGLMNLYFDEESDTMELSPSIKITNTPSSSATSTPSSFTFDVENMIDEAFGSLQAESTALSNDITPSFHSASARRTPAKTVGRSAIKTPLTPKTAKTPNRKVSRNTPLTSTMRDGAPDFDLPGDMTVISSGSVRRRGVKETLDITPITEEEEEKEEEGGSAERGASILEGYFDSSHSTIEEEEEEKENETPCNMSDISPVTTHKRRSESPAKEHRSPTKRHAGDKVSPAVVSTSRDKVSPAVSSKVSPVVSSKVSPAVTESRRKTPMSRSPLSCLKGTTTSSFKRGEVSPAEPDFKKEDSPITVRPKPKFKVVNGKLMPI